MLGRAENTRMATSSIAPGAPSDAVFILLERFLDMFQNRFSIVFQYLGLFFFAPINRVPVAILTTPWNPGLELGFDAVPISIAHHHPREILDEWNRLRQFTCTHGKTHVND